MKYMSFAHTTDALLAGNKSVTRRDWKDSYARQFQQWDFAIAVNRQLRFGGKRVGIVQLTRDPYREPLGMMTDDEEVAEGGLWGSAAAFIAAYGKPPEHKVWMVRLRLICVFPIQPS